MIDIDYEMVMVSREYLPEWCDCSNLVGSASWCGDDPRAELFYEDAIQWFISRYGDGRNELEPYDVIIMDALDPDSAVPFSDTLYDNAQFVEALSTALNPDGIMIMQTGAGSDDEELPIEYSKGKNYERLMINHMRNNGFVDHKNYEESSTRFMGVWGFSILFKNWETRNRWFSSSASIDLELRKRATSTKNGESPFRFFDGASMMLYQDSSRFDEERMCLQNEIDDVFCRYARGFDEGNENIPSASLSALVDDHSKVSIITRQDIPEGAFVALESGVDAWEISSQTLQFLETTSQGMPTERFKTNIEQLGSPTCLRGGKTLFVDTDIFGLLRQEDYGAQSFNIGLNDTDLKHLLQCPFDIFAIEDRDAYARRVRFQHSATAFIPAGSMLQPFRFY